MTPLSHAHYIRKINRDLPREAFAPAPKKLLRMFAYLASTVLAYLGFRVTSSVLWCAALSLFIGHTLACIGFLAHELAHGAIVRAPRTRHALELFFWALVLVPATVWKRVHNHTHHVHSNTPRDSDRPFLHSESSLLTRCYTRIFYPSKFGPRWNPIVALHLIPYIIRNVVASLYPSSRDFALVPATPLYSRSQRWAIVSEIFVIIALQVCIFVLVGASWRAYIWASPLAYLVTSSVTMTYIFTNHFLNPISEVNDPLLGTTSVSVSSLFDHLHEHFSLHTEHHLSPAMNSDYYPLVACALRKHFPERYNSIALLDAWKRLWNGPEFVLRTPNPLDPIGPTQ